MRHIKNLIPSLLRPILIISFILSAHASVYAQNTVEHVTSKEMKNDLNVASARARETLDFFWKKHKNPEPGELNFSLKVAISNGKTVEHFWLAQIQKQGEIITGVINNNPHTVKTVRMGQRITVPPQDISDWMFVRNGKFVGNRTLRVLMKYNKDLAAKFTRFLDTELTR